MASLAVGCTGWSYDDWVGGFYPPGTPAAEYLRRYARVFGFAEVDSTYYRAPTVEQTLRWARETPPGFRFAVKVPGEVTHERRLAGADAPLDAFLASLGPLRREGKLACVVAVLPPSFRATPEHAARLDAFLARLEGDVRVAVELRHASWWTPQTRRLLESRGAALVRAESMHVETPDWETADLLYARLVGDREIERFDRLQRDRREDVARLVAALAPAVARAREAFLAANNHFAGNAPETVRLVCEAFGLPLPDLGAARRDAAQRTLFD